MAELNILIPCYNAGAFLGETIKSVLRQSFTDWELIILDDCSTDDSYNVATGFAEKDSRIKVYRNEANVGMLGNWNKGITLCTAPYFVKLDADDIWHEQMLAKAMEVLKKNEDVVLVFSRYVHIDEQGNEIKESEWQLPAFAKDKAFSCVPIVKLGPDKMLAYPILRQGLSVMRRKVFDEIGAYRTLLTPKTQASTDVEFYFRVGAHYKIYCIDEVLYHYRLHQASISALDQSNFLTDTKLYEIKYCIISYYAEHGLLSLSEKKKFLKDIKRRYNYSEIAYFKNTSQWSRFFSKLIGTFFLQPLDFFNFYFKRGAKKLVS